MIRMSYEDLLFILQNFEEFLLGRAFLTAILVGKIFECTCVSSALLSGKLSTWPNALDNTRQHSTKPKTIEMSSTFARQF